MRIAILDDYQSVALQCADWASLVGVFEIAAFSDHAADVPELCERLQRFDCVVVMRERTAFSRAVFDRLPNLKLLVTTGARNAVIDLQAATDARVVVCGTRSVIYPTAELTWGLILALARNIVAEDQAVRAGKWQVGLGVDLRDRTLGIVGLGNLGQMVAKVGLAFGMKVVAWSQNLNAAVAQSHGVLAVTKQELLSQSDVVSIHLILSDRTRGLFGDAEFAAMKPTALFVNTSRAQIVDEGAIIRALEGKLIQAAALDVFEKEPLSADSRLRSLPNLILSPHTGYATQVAYGVYYGDAVEDIRCWLGGAPVRTLN